MNSLFDLPDEPKPLRAKRRVMMHVIDAGYGCSSEVEGGSHLVRFGCNCGHATEWMRVATVSEGKRGIPCPKCNQKAE